MKTRRKVEAQRWFQQAFYDLKATRWNIRGGFYDTACFLAQQAKVAEQALTAAEKIFSNIQNYYQAAGESEIFQIDEE